MTNVHITVGTLVFVLNFAAGLWGLFAWLTRRPSPFFWYLLRAAQASIVLQAVLGGILVIMGEESGDGLHYLYGILPVAVMLVTEGMRLGAAQQVVGETDYKSLPEDEAQKLAMDIFIAETRVMALGSLIIAALALRAGMTAGFIG